MSLSLLLVGRRTLPSTLAPPHATVPCHLGAQDVANSAFSDLKPQLTGGSTALEGAGVGTWDSHSLAGPCRGGRGINQLLRILCIFLSDTASFRHSAAW